MAGSDAMSSSRKPAAEEPPGTRWTSSRIRATSDGARAHTDSTRGAGSRSAPRRSASRATARPSRRWAADSSSGTQPNQTSMPCGSRAFWPMAWASRVDLPKPAPACTTVTRRSKRSAMTSRRRDRRTACDGPTGGGANRKGRGPGRGSGLGTTPPDRPNRTRGAAGGRPDAFRGRFGSDATLSVDGDHWTDAESRTGAGRHRRGHDGVAGGARHQGPPSGAGPGCTGRGRSPRPGSAHPAWSAGPIAPPTPPPAIDGPRPPRGTGVVAAGPPSSGRDHPSSERAPVRSRWPPWT